MSGRLSGRMSCAMASEHGREAPSVVDRVRARLSGSLAAIFDQALVSGTRWITAMVVGAGCGVGELGRYALAFSVVMFGLTVQQSVIAGPYTFYRQGRSRATQRRLAATSLALSLTWGFGLSLLLGGVWLLAASGWLPLSFEEATAAGRWSRLVSAGGILPWLTLLIIPAVLVESVRRSCLARNRIDLALAVDGLLAALQVGGLALLSGLDRLALSDVGAVMVVAHGIAAVVGLAGLDSLAAPRRRDLVRHARLWLKFGGWSLASSLTGLVHASLLTWWLALTLGSGAAGILAAHLSLVALANPLTQALNNLLGPRIARARSLGGAAEVAKAALVGVLELTGSMAAFGLLIAPWAEVLVSRLYGVEHGASRTLFLVLIGGSVATAAGYAAEQTLWGLRRPVLNWLVELFGVVVTAGSAAALMPTHGIVGAATGLMIGCTSQAVLRCWLAWRVVVRSRRDSASSVANAATVASVTACRVADAHRDDVSRLDDIARNDFSASRDVVARRDASEQRDVGAQRMESVIQVEDGRRSAVAFQSEEAAQHAGARRTQSARGTNMIPAADSCAIRSGAIRSSAISSGGAMSSGSSGGANNGLSWGASSGAMPWSTEQEAAGTQGRNVVLGCAWLLMFMTIFAVDDDTSSGISVEWLLYFKMACRVVAFCVLNLSLMRFLYESRAWDVMRRVVPWVLFSAWSLLTITWSPTPVWSTGQLWTLVIYVTFAAHVAVSIRSADDVSFLLKGLSIGLLAINGGIIVLRLVAPELTGLSRLQPSVIGDATSLAASASLGLLLLVAAHQLWGWTWTRSLLVPGIAIHGTMMLLAASRTSFAATALSIGYLFTRHSRRGVLWTTVLAISFGIGAYVVSDPDLGLSELALQRVERYIDRENDPDQYRTTFNGRTQVWEIAWTSFAASPWLGQGYYNIAPTATVELWGHEQRAHAHNLPLQMLVSTGVIGFLLWTWAMGAPYWRALSGSRVGRDVDRATSRRIWEFALVVGGWFFLWCQFTVSFMGTPQVETSIYFALVGLLWAEDCNRSGALLEPGARSEPDGRRGFNAHFGPAALPGTRGS